jgi:hypothetical protein
MSTPFALGGNGREMIITNNNYPRGNGNIDNVRPRLPDAQQSAIVKGGGGGGNKDTQQSAIGKGGGGGGNKDIKEEDCDSC